MAASPSNKALPQPPARALSDARALRFPQAPPADVLHTAVLLRDAEIRRALLRMAHEVVERNADPARLYLVGIPNGGVPLARQMARNLREVAGLHVFAGILDTSLYRDDALSQEQRPPLRRTEMPSAVDGRVVILVDDVVNTGRTIRAAMDALLDFGRPRAVQVAALVDRGHRELPIRIDYVGKNIPTQSGDRVKLFLAGKGAEAGAAEAAMKVLLLQGAAGEGA